jgi:hypothetical protein
VPLEVTVLKERLQHALPVAATINESLRQTIGQEAEITIFSLSCFLSS